MTTARVDNLVKTAIIKLNLLSGGRRERKQLFRGGRGGKNIITQKHKNINI